jgi:hypothetical protein
MSPERSVIYVSERSGLACLEDFLEYKQITQDYAPLEEAR